MLALIVPSIALFTWGIYVNAQRVDAVGALVLSLTVGALGALGAVVVTSEVRDNYARVLRNRLHKLHNAQVLELSNAIAKLETQKDNLSMRYTALVIDNTKTNQGAKATAANKKDNNMLMMMLALMAMMNKGGGGSSTGSGGTIPSLQANRSQLPYGAIAGSQARPGAGGVNYFSPTSYTPRAAGGGMMYGGGGLSDLGGYSDGGRLLRGPGDGVSDSIPATIGGKQPARLATGEFVVPARIVSELGNGSTEAGAQKLYAMMDRVQKARRKTKNVAADTKAHKYLPS